MKRSRMLFFIAMCASLIGCTNTPAPPRSALLENLSFANGVDESARLGEPVLTSQLVSFVGKPDITVPWGQVEQTFSSRAGIDKATVDTAMKHMRDAYVFTKGVTNAPPNTLPMDQVEVWFYMWNEPVQLFVSDVFHTPASKMSILVLVEKGRVVGTTDILFNGR
jgi:hypothetical protein